VENLRDEIITDAFEVSNVVTSQNLNAQASSVGDLRTYRIKLPADLGSSAKIRFEIYEDGSLVDRNENENGELPISSKTENGETFYATDNFRFVTWDTDDAHAGNQTIKVKLGDTVRMNIVVDGNDLTFFELPIGLPPSESSPKAIRTVDTRFVKLNYGDIVADTSVSAVLERKDKAWAQGAVRFNNIDEVPKSPVKNMIGVKGIATGNGQVDLIVQTSTGGSPSGFPVSVNFNLTPGTTPDSYHIAQVIAQAINTEEGRNIATAHNTYPSPIQDGITALASAYAHVLIDEGNEVIYNSLSASTSIPNVSVFIPSTGLSSGHAKNMHDVAMLALNYDDEDANTMDIFVVNDLSRGSKSLDGLALPYYYITENSPIVGSYCIELSQVRDDATNLFIAAHEAGHVLLKFCPLRYLFRHRIGFDFSDAALQHCSMAIAVPISKRGTFTIPPEIRKRLGVDQLENPMLLVEERDGKLYLEPAAAVPVRDIPKATLRSWIQQDEAEMAAFKKTRKRRS